jgi:hypothetical protein
MFDSKCFKNYLKQIMKNRIIIALVVVSLAFFASCEDENTVSTGDDRSQFTGTWTCNEKSKVFGNSVYTVSISNIGDGDSVSIRNFYNLGNNFFGIGIVGGNAITIPFQSIDGTIVQGSGLRSNASKFELDYFTNDAGAKDTVEDTFTR